MTAFPSDEDLNRAYRAANNQHAFYEGLGSLKDVLAVYKTARAGYASLQEEMATLERQIAEARARWEGVETSYTTRVAELEEQYAAACIPLVAHKEELEAEVAALSAKVEALDREAKTLASRRESLHNDIEAMLQRYRG